MGIRRVSDLRVARSADAETGGNAGTEDSGTGRAASASIISSSSSVISDAFVDDGPLPPAAGPCSSSISESCSTWSAVRGALFFDILRRFLRIGVSVTVTTLVTAIALDFLGEKRLDLFTI